MVHFGPKSHSIFVRMDLDFVRMDQDFVRMDQDFLRKEKKMRRAISSKKANPVPPGFRQISFKADHIQSIFPFSWQPHTRKNC